MLKEAAAELSRLANSSKANTFDVDRITKIVETMEQVKALVLEEVGSESRDECEESGDARLRDIEDRLKRVEEKLASLSVGGDL